LKGFVDTGEDFIALAAEVFERFLEPLTCEEVLMPLKLCFFNMRVFLGGFSAIENLTAGGFETM
jgi:hypothetical protein